MTHQTRTAKPLFELGRVVGTLGAMEACPIPRQLDCLCQHLVGNWGELCEDDKAANDAAVRHGDRILSAYAIDPAQPASMTGNKIWIITEADRSVTTLLLPDEY